MQCSPYNESCSSEYEQVLHGTEDTRVQLEYSQRLHDSASSNDKKFLIYPAAKHQLLQDLPSITETVIRDITQWLLARV